MSQTVCRVLNIIFILGILFYYQNVTMMRTEEIKRYEAQVEAADKMTKEYEQQLLQANEEAAEKAFLKEIVFGNGTFSGTGQGFGGAIDIEIVVEDYKITQVSIVSAENEDLSYYEQAVKVLPKLIIEKQSADVDTVSGATFSSQGILEAASEAIQKAKDARPKDEVLLAERKIEDGKEKIEGE